MAPYLAYPAFQALKQGKLFMQARVAHHTAIWNDEVDIAPESLYLERLYAVLCGTWQPQRNRGQLPIKRPIGLQPLQGGRSRVRCALVFLQLLLD